MKALRTIGYKFVINKSFLHDHVRHSTEDGHICTRLERKPQLGKVHQLDAARIHDDHLGAVLSHSLLHLQGDDRMVFARVRPGDNEYIIEHDLGGGVAHRGGANRLL